MADADVAETRADILGWGDHSNHRAHYLDIITSCCKEEKVLRILLYAPFVHSLFGILLVSRWGPALLYGISRSFPIWFRQIVPDNPIKAVNSNSLCEDLS